MLLPLSSYGVCEILHHDQFLVSSPSMGITPCVPPHEESDFSHFGLAGWRMPEYTEDSQQISTLPSSTIQRKTFIQD